MARYFKERGRPLHRDSLAAGWGECTRYVEIADDRYAARQVEVFDECRVLRYDRHHWCDRFGQLIGRLFSRKQKAISARLSAEAIEAPEFERVWLTAQQSLLWNRQVALSCNAERGAVPWRSQQARDT